MTLVEVEEALELLEERVSVLYGVTGRRERTP